jgi:hypothetical protein
MSKIVKDSEGREMIVSDEIPKDVTKVDERKLKIITTNDFTMANGKIERKRREGGDGREK